MKVSSIGDLAKNLQLRRDTTRIKSDLIRYTNELSSGVSQDLIARFKGNFGPLSGIERGLQRMESFKAVQSEHQLVLTAQQTTLTNLRELGTISGTLMMVQDTGDAVLVRNAGLDALSRFRTAVSNLNIQSGGRSVFSGVATDQPAIADADTILAALESEIALAGAVTASDVAAVVEGWFGTGGGFDTIGYVGGAPAGSGPQLSEGETAPASPTGDHDSLRSFLAGLATGALLGRNALTGDTVEQGRLARTSGEAIFRSDSELVNLMAEIGTSEGQLDRARSEVFAEAGSLEIARSELIGVDPYDAAVNLESAETQLQTLYTITARLSRLSLAEFL